MLIPNLTLSNICDYRNDYVIQIDITSSEVLTAGGHLSVYDPLYKPTRSSSNMAPMENKDSVTSRCQTSSPGGIVVSAGDRTELAPDKRTLTIQNVIREDQGPHQCGIWNPVSPISSDPFTLNVARVPCNLPDIPRCDLVKWTSKFWKQRPSWLLRSVNIS
ncbi:cell adhesion molecule CEACAM8-like isoform X2 [Macrotis lagotis]